MKAMLKRFASDERGMETVEYVVLVSLIVAGLVVVGVAIEVWQLVVLIPLFKKQIKLMNERDAK